MKRIAKPIDTIELCSYGCGNIARYENGSGKLMCEDRHNRCPALRKKNSQGLKENHKIRDQKQIYFDLPEETKRKMAWAKGLTKNDHASILSWSEKLSGKRRIAEPERLSKQIYRERCQFNLSTCIERVKGYEILVEKGMYHKNRNLDGVVRDHMVSVEYGYNHDIPPEIMSHPANCQFITHKENARKSIKCDITVEQLLEEIEEWGYEGNWYTSLIESQWCPSSNLGSPTK